MPEINHYRENIKSLALKHGFDICTFARPKIDDTHAKALDTWIDAGMHGDMAYMGESVRTHKRKMPETMLDSVRTSICVGMRYSPPSNSLEEGIAAKDHGVISAYAQGYDYHDVMKRRLKLLAEDLDQLLGYHDQRVFVDTAPVLEHALAQQSGLGWQGKHSLTINRQLGSWLLLGEIFTTAELLPDEPASLHCGSCTACIDVCPTKAIVAPFVVDARRCISYLTIEFRGFIPRELRTFMGNRIFGCDDCQSICPWNRHAGTPEPDLLASRSENHLPTLREILLLDAKSFQLRFRNSPVKRTGRAGLLRNTVIAMGNSGDKGFITDLRRVMEDEEPLIRGHAAWAIAQICPQDRQGEFIELLRYHADRETHANVRFELTEAIKELKVSEEL